jgi:ornithine cyclodeaminase/alanine dehydrogenase-like protein (mu-crystallin family)
MQEVDSATVERSLLVVDSRDASLAETGDLIVPIGEGRISEDHIQAELGEIANGSKPGRTDADQITLYKSVGVAVQDAAAAGLALRKAEELGLGRVIEL